jgi:hypothetical protein
MTVEVSAQYFMNKQGGNPYEPAGTASLTEKITMGLRNYQGKFDDFLQKKHVLTERLW